jgi:hypothetical protein
MGAFNWVSALGPARVTAFELVQRYMAGLTIGATMS